MACSNIRYGKDVTREIGMVFSFFSVKDKYLILVKLRLIEKLNCPGFCKHELKTRVCYD